MLFEEKNFWKEKSVIFFLAWAERKGLLDEHPLTGLLKLYITSPEKQAKQSTFCQFGFCNLSRRLRQDFWPFSKYFPTSLTEMHSTCLEKHFEGNQKFEKNSIQSFTISVQFWTFQGRVCGQVLNALVCESGRSYWEIIFSCRNVSPKAFSEHERRKC